MYVFQPELDWQDFPNHNTSLQSIFALCSFEIEQFDRRADLPLSFDLVAYPCVISWFMDGLSPTQMKIPTNGGEDLKSIFKFSIPQT